MLRYLITQAADDTVILESLHVDESERRTLQLTGAEFSILMRYPEITKKEVVDKLWEISDKSLGKAAVDRLVNTAFEIMGR